MKSSYAFRPVAGSGRVMLLACGLLAAGSSVGAPADHVIDNGQVVNLPGDRPDPWTTGGHLFVGFNDTGMLNVSDGAEVNAGFTVVGSFVAVADMRTVERPAHRPVEKASAAAARATTRIAAKRAIVLLKKELMKA